MLYLRRGDPGFYAFPRRDSVETQDSLSSHRRTVGPFPERACRPFIILSFFQRTAAFHSAAAPTSAHHQCQTGICSPEAATRRLPRVDEVGTRLSLLPSATCLRILGISLPADGGPANGGPANAAASGDFELKCPQRHLDSVLETATTAAEQRKGLRWTRVHRHRLQVPTAVLDFDRP